MTFFGNGLRGEEPWGLRQWDRRLYRISTERRTCCVLIAFRPNAWIARRPCTVRWTRQVTILLPRGAGACERRPPRKVESSRGGFVSITRRQLAASLRACIHVADREAIARFLLDPATEASINPFRQTSARCNAASGLGRASNSAAPERRCLASPVFCGPSIRCQPVSRWCRNSSARAPTVSPSTTSATAASSLVPYCTVEGL